MCKLSRISNTISFMVNSIWFSTSNGRRGVEIRTIEKWEIVVYKIRSMNRADSVWHHTMKLQGIVLVLVFGLLGLAGIVSSFCLVRNTLTPKVYFYHCFKSNDYLADLDKAPIDVSRLTFTNSKINIIRNGSFTRLNKYLRRIVIFHSNVEEIENHAFRGLYNLDLLGITGCNLKVIKSVWFEGLTNLKTLSLQHNKIKHVGDNLFAILPPLESMDISMNEITCLNIASFGNFRTKEFHFRDNPMTWMCQNRLINWVKDKNIRYDQFDHDYSDTMYNLSVMCIRKFSKSQPNEQDVDKCVKETTRNYLPTNGNYTVNDTCNFLRDNHKESPFLVCVEQKPANLIMGWKYPLDELYVQHCNILLLIIAT